MNYDELNEYIKHYIEKDKTQSAIMLTGDWGTGKSYYIHNFLEPFLKDNNRRCAIVSLYGLKSLSEISKNIYFELRSIGFSKKSEARTTGGVAAMVVGKTILNGLTSKIGFDIGSISDEDLEKVYSSINLSGALVILEDLERSNINIIDVLGYVNSLVEQDGVKVLLVANEDEILKYYDSQPDKDGKTYKIPDEKTITYLKTKEKTISETILFDGDYESAIKKIIGSFGNEILNRFLTDEIEKDVLRIMSLLKNYNLRSFIFACQKTVDIFEKLESFVRTEDYLFKTVFYGIIAFSMRIKNGDFPSWNTNGLFSKELGLDNYPLYKFCYDYIRWHKIDVDNIQKTLPEYKTLRLFYKIGFKNDNDLNIIFKYYLYNEKEVMSALKNIEKRLDDAEDIPFYNYEKLVYYLIQCKSVLCFDYSLCKKEMINNIRLLCQSEEKKTIFSFWSVRHFDFENEDGKKQFLDFTNEITNALHFTTNPNNIFNFSYSPNILNELYDYVARNKEEISTQKFISKFDLDKLVKMIFECNPEQLQDFRGMLLSVYRDSFKKDSLDDCIFMEELKSKLESTIKSLPSMDKIQLLQINYLIDNLAQFISQLS